MVAYGADGWLAKCGMIFSGKGSERDLLRSVSLNSVDRMRTGLGNGAGRGALRGTGGLALMLAGALIPLGALLPAGAALGQVKVPRYQSPIEAPAPQLTLPVPSAIEANGTVVEYSIVRVNDQIIDNSDYMRAAEELKGEAQRTNLSAEELAERQKDLLRDMIDQQLLLSRGKELDISADTEVVQRLDEIRKQNKFDSMEELEKAVRQSGISYEDFKANIKNSIISQEVVNKEVGQTLRLTAKQEQAYYEAHKQEYEQPEQVRLSEILIATPEDATDAQIAQAKSRAEDVEAKLKAGGSFEEMAKQLSGGQTAAKGGDLGDFKRGALGSSALDAGGITAPIRTRQGFVVLKVTEHTQAGIPPLSAVDQQVQEAIYRDAIQPALRTYLTGLREKAYIDIEPGYVDTGASAKQTKPVFSSYAAPAAKKKVQKARLDSGHAAASAAAGGAKAGTATAANSAAAKTAKTAKTTKTKMVAAGKKSKKIRREKIRFGQAPRNALPASPEEAMASGTDQGPGAVASVLPAPGAAIAPIEQTADVASDDEPLAPKTAERKKTRYSDRAPIEDKARRDTAKAAKVKAKAAATPAPQTAEEKAAQKLQAAPLGLSGDTATKKKKKRVKGEAKARLQEQAPAPPKAKPEATPIPPKSVRENGEPVVSPPPPVPAVTVPADAQPSTTVK
jgi:peptidyl-prolyl cis-trans isomerase SurA